MKIAIVTISHEDQNYDTCGDWHFDEEGRLTIFVSKLGDEKMEMLIAMHEIWEAMLCKWNGVEEYDVTAFDVAFENLRTKDNDSEPGDETAAPYYKEHQLATKVEKLCARQAGVSWKDYDRKVKQL